MNKVNWNWLDCLVPAVLNTKYVEPGFVAIQVDWWLKQVNSTNLRELIKWPKIFEIAIV